MGDRCAVEPRGRPGWRSLASNDQTWDNPFEMENHFSNHFTFGFKILVFERGTLQPVTMIPCSQLSRFYMFLLESPFGLSVLKISMESERQQPFEKNKSFSDLWLWLPAVRFRDYVYFFHTCKAAFLFFLPALRIPRKNLAWWNADDGQNPAPPRMMIIPVFMGF